MESKKYMNQYPNNLAEKPRIGLWTLQELCLLAVTGLLLVLIGLRSHMIGISLCITAGLSLLSAHFTGSDRSVFDYLWAMLVYLKNPRVWEYMPGERKAVVQKTDKKKKRRKSNVFWILTACILIAGFAALLIWSEVKKRSG